MNVTTISIFFEAIKKGKRKATKESLRVAELSGHLTLTPDQLNAYERQAWAMVDDRNYRQVSSTARLTVNHGEIDGEIIMVQLLPKQSQILMR